jgi:hypothetical protein
MRCLLGIVNPKSRGNLLPDRHRFWKVYYAMMSVRMTRIDPFAEKIRHALKRPSIAYQHGLILAPIRVDQARNLQVYQRFSPGPPTGKLILPTSRRLEKKKT